ncbi:hypothetical protein BCR44DRAFT_322324 [Catenaria anguillulae PL171]|uniref:Uncharacterized protein n=1 Tax=Catenaria anguillulae PL171 TaxID=765915 RepID=A0A1Y2HPX3_9FUNG|nr:hypothetical protein BCR44DRAFT_322324 [Catenaria anguillulae PL171]
MPIHHFGHIFVTSFRLFLSVIIHESDFIHCTMIVHPITAHEQQRATHNTLHSRQDSFPPMPNHLLQSSSLCFFLSEPHLPALDIQTAAYLASALSACVTRIPSPLPPAAGEASSSRSCTLRSTPQPHKRVCWFESTCVDFGDMPRQRMRARAKAGEKQSDGSWIPVWASER